MAEYKIRPIVTESGFKCDLVEERIDDLEVFEYIVEFEDDNFKNAINFLKKILSEEDFERIKDHVKAEDGRVPASKLILEALNILFIFNTFEDKKK